MDQAILEPPKRTGPFDPYGEAEARGYSLFGPVGRVGFGALQRSFTLACAHRSRFDDTRIRMRCHVCLYWPKGRVKNTIFEVFREECASFENGVRQEEETLRPVYLPVTNATAAAFQGSFNDGLPVLPLSIGSDFIISPELTTLLGGDAEEVATVTNFLNEGLESGEITTGRVKFARKGRQVKEYYEAHGVYYNDKKGILQYTMRSTFWCATRPMDRHTVARLWASGYFDRLNMVRPTYANEDEEDRQTRWRGPVQDWGRLRAFNDRLWNNGQSAFVRFSPAPDDMHDRVMDELYRLYKQYEAAQGRIPDMRSMRDLTNVYQILAAYAIVDTVKNDGKGPYENVRYDLGCEQRAIAALPDYVSSRVPPTHE